MEFGIVFTGFYEAVDLVGAPLNQFFSEFKKIDIQLIVPFKAVGRFTADHVES